jgi:hypothetical protein
METLVRNVSETKNVNRMVVWIQIFYIGFFFNIQDLQIKRTRKHHIVPMRVHTSCGSCVDAERETVNA